MINTKRLILEKVNSVLWITLNRPEKHNAMDHDMVTELTDALNAAEQDSDCYLIVIQGRGKTFCAGHDLHWMRQASAKDHEGNLKEANHLANFFDRLYHFNKPIVALAQGPALGGGVCVLACADYVLVTKEAHFGFPEVKLGLIPAVITPIIIAAIGARHAQRFFITGETFSAKTAQRLGLVQDIVNDHEARHRTLAVTEQLLKNGPQSMIALKKLLRKISPYPVRNHQATTTSAIAELRTTEEAIEGVSSFFERRMPKWQVK